MTHFNDDMTLAVARDKLRELVYEGHDCPLCTQMAKVYRRNLTSVATRAMIALYREYGTGYGHLPDAVRKHAPGVANQGGYANLAQHWGLIEDECSRREDGGRTGFWRVTRAGEQFLRGEVTVPKYVLLYNGRCLKREGEAVGVRDALGKRFNYYELMAGV